MDIEAQRGAQQSPPTYEQATFLPRGPSTRETTPLIDNQLHGAEPPAAAGSAEKSYGIQNIIRFWLGLSFAEPQSNTCSGYGSLVCRLIFVLLFLWGAIIIALTVLKGGGEKFYNTCSEFFTVIILTYLGGLSFVLCFFYCLSVHFWECCESKAAARNRRRNNSRSGRDFNICSGVALLLSLFFVTVLGGLVSWIGEHSDYVIHGCNREVGSGEPEEGVLCSCQRKIGEIDSPFYMLPLWTAGTMLAIVLVCGVVNCFGWCVASYRCRSNS